LLIEEKPKRLPSLALQQTFSIALNNKTSDSGLNLPPLPPIIRISLLFIDTTTGLTRGGKVTSGSLISSQVAQGQFMYGTYIFSTELRHLPWLSYPAKTNTNSLRVQEAASDLAILSGGVRRSHWSFFMS